jgi:Uma2 family endonuclease
MLHPVYYSYREYLALDAASNVKLEYAGGQIFAMAGGTPEHSALISSVNAHLANQVRGTHCRVHMADLRIRVIGTGLATYPDLSVICGPWERDPEDRNTLLNPTMLIEVLSPSTEEYDRGEKFEHYKQIPSLRTYLLVAQDRRMFEIRTRGADGVWRSAVLSSGQVVNLESIGCTLSIDAVYDDATEPPTAHRSDEAEI